MKAISHQGPAAYKSASFTRYALPPTRHPWPGLCVKTPLVVCCSDSLHPLGPLPEASCNQTLEPVVASHVHDQRSAWHSVTGTICSWASNHRAWLAAAVGVAALGLMPIMVGATPGLATAPLSSIPWGDWAMERSIVLVGKVSGLNIAAKICLVLASTWPAAVAFGAIYSKLTSTDMKASCIKFYALLNKLPGMAVLNEKTLPTAFLVNFAFILGTFVFAIMLGIVTEEVKTQFKNFRNGKYQMHQEGHVVLLNWNQQTIHTLRAIAAARKAGQGGMFDRPVAVLSDTPKAEMDSTIQKRLKGVHLEIITRTGSPSTPGDLASVALAQAAAVIVHTPEHTPGAYGGAWPAHGAAAQVAVALAAASPNIANQNVIFQSPPEHGTALEHVGAFKRLIKLGDNMQIMKYSDEDLVNRTVTVSAVQPGMQRVMAQLMAQPGCRIQTVPPSLVGCTYQHARRMFADGVLCGVLRGQVADLLVPETYVLKANEQLVMLSPSPEDVPVNPMAEPIFQRAAESVKGRLAGHVPYKSQPRHICVISPAADKALALVEVLSELAPRGSVVTFLTPKASSGPTRKGNCTYKYLTLPSSADACVSGHLLKEAGIHDATAVMVFGLEDLSPNAADAYVTSTLLQVQDSVRQSGRLDAPHFVAQIRKASTQSSISTFLNLLKKEARASGANANQIINKPDLFLSDDMCGSILAHAAYQPAFAQLVTDMLDSQGAEVYIRSPQAYNIRQGDLLMFADVAETTRAFNETAIGVIRADGSFTLAPEPTYPLNLQVGDKIISLAEDYGLKRA